MASSITITITNICSCFLILLSIFIYHCSSNELHDNAADFLTERNALEIIIGGGNAPAPAPSLDCPPPPPPICPPPQSPPPPPPPPPPSPSPRPPPPPPPPSPRPSPPPPPPPTPGPFPSENVRRDYFIIQRFKKRITSDPLKILKSWESTDVCHYKGFKCDIVPDQQKTAVAIASFNEFYFAGPNLTISEFLEELRDLAVFHINSNNFTGPVPTSFGQRVRFLYELDLSNNKYTGGFPMAILGGVNLTFIDIRFNFFTGPIPSQLYKMDVDVIFLNNNKFSGHIPDTLGFTPALYLTFANNKFTGPIPRSIGKARRLREVLFLNNKLSGCLPYEIGLLKNLTTFDVGTNKLTGPIPHSFGCLSKIQNLNLAMNEFYGEVPEMLCKQKSLRNLTLSYNYFTQVGPACRKLIAKKYLDIRQNCILGLPNQRSGEECERFFTRHKYCPNEKSLHYVPCKRIRRTLEESTAVASPPRSYDALRPHQLRV